MMTTVATMVKVITTLFTKEQISANVRKRNREVERLRSKLDTLGLTDPVPFGIVIPDDKNERPFVDINEE